MPINCRVIDGRCRPPLSSRAMANTPPPEIDLDDLRRHMVEHGARSPIVQWMVANHDEFAAAVAVAGIRWEKVAAYLAEHGLRTARGGIPSGETMRRCWIRARRMVAKQRDGQRQTAVPPADQPAPEPKFKPFTSRNEGRGVSAAERQALGDATAPADQAAQPTPKFQRSWMRNEGRGTSAAEQPAPDHPAALAAPEPPPKPKFEFVRLRNEGRGVSAAERRTLGDPTAPADPDDPKWKGDKSR